MTSLIAYSDDASHWERRPFGTVDDVFDGLADDLPDGLADGLPDDLPHQVSGISVENSGASFTVTAKHWEPAVLAHRTMRMTKLKPLLAALVAALLTAAYLLLVYPASSRAEALTLALVTFLMTSLITFLMTSLITFLMTSLITSLIS